MWNPNPGWAAQTSFTAPVAVPGVEPDAAPTVCVTFSAAWLPYVLGALAQLVQPAAWAAADDTALQLVLSQAQDLLDTFGQAETCPVLDFQFTSGCLLQFSTDGGTTWNTVSGYPINAAACYTGATGPEGPEGGYTPGAAGNPQDVSTSQQACNIAAYLATNVLQASMAQMVTNYNDAKSLVDSVAALFDLLPGIDAIFGVGVTAGAILYNYYTSATIAAFTTASTDPTLLDEIKCAIYGAIKADGQVDSSNFAALVTAIGAISYSSSEVITALVAYLNALTVTGLEQMQLQGSLFVGDCSDCGGSDVALFINGAAPQQVNLADQIPFGTGDFTIGGWMKHSLAGGQGGIIFGGWPNPYVSLGYNSGGTNTFYNLSDGTTGNFSVPTTNIADGDNHLVVFRRSGANVALIVDNNIVATSTSAGTGSMGPCNPYFQGFGFGYANLGGGAIDPQPTVIVWNWGTWLGTALSDADIAAWWADGSFAPPPNSPTNVWLFDEGTGNTVNDTAGTNNGTITGTANWTTHT